MSDTPRTDIVTYDTGLRSGDDPNEPADTVVPAHFARQLERELAAAKERIAELEQELNGRHDRLLREGDYHSLHKRVDEVISLAQRATGSTSLSLQRRVIEGALWSGFQATDELRRARAERDALRAACKDLLGLAEREGWIHVAINNARAALGERAK